jgi:hypothetical protein
MWVAHPASVITEIIDIDIPRTCRMTAPDR